MDDIKRICLWSGPRNISTALMYAFAQRKDSKVFDEPLYAFYLANHPEARFYHPGAEAILRTMDNNGSSVVETMLTNRDKPVLFFKHMTHHLLDLDCSFMSKTLNIILTRNPIDMLPSFDKVIKNASLADVGYKLHVELMRYYEKNTIPFVVLESKRLLLDPEGQLNKLCAFLNIPFDKNMLSWQPHQRKEDGIWSKYWYSSVHQSSGFAKYKSKETPFPEHLNPLLNQCLPYYNKMMKKAI
jgi:hypothetical protein